MAVIKAKPEKFMPFLLPLVRRRLIIPEMVVRVAEDTFKGAQGDTVTMRVNGLHTVARKYEFRTRTAPIVLDDIQGEGGIPVKLDTHTYSATGLTDEQMTLDEIGWLTDVMEPQATAVANDLEKDVADTFQNELLTRYSIDFAHGDDPYLVAVEAQRILDGQRGLVPADGRFWLVGTNVAASILAHDRVSKSSEGTNAMAESALHRAEIANIAGFRVVKSLEVDPNFSVFMHKSALVLGTVAPVAPRGASQSAKISKDGFGMRWIADYDANFLRDRSIVSMFSGLTPVYDERIGGDGTDRYNLKPLESYTMVGDDVPKTFRAIKVNFTPAAGGSVIPAAA
ncbi:MAG TPA: hypothetical protein VFX41_07855 [Actinomycetales bacterium]|nr:hypothetical protein [Actinomycetales bacterium]